MPEIKTVPRSPQLDQLADWFEYHEKIGIEFDMGTVVHLIRTWIPLAEDQEDDSQRTSKGIIQTS